VNINGRNKILFIATIDVHIVAFHIPFMKLLQEWNYVVEVAARDTGSKKFVEERGFKFHDVPFSRNPLSVYNIRAFFIILNLMRRNEFLMVHTHTPVASFLGRIAGKMAGVPRIVYTAHGFHFHEYGSRLKNFAYFRLEKFAGKFTDVLITINRDDYEIAKKSNLVPNGKIVYIKGVGVDTERIKPENIEDNRLESINGDLHYRNPLILTVGRLEREKNFDQFLHMLKIIKDSGKKFHGLVIGEGPLKDYLEKIINKLKLNDIVKFTGYFTRAFELISQAEVYIFTSSREGLPVSVMEAMAVEKPVVAYNIRGVRDLVVDGETGFLIPYRNVQQLAEKVMYLMNNPEVARIMGRKGRERIEEEFSIKKIKTEMSNLYREILGG